MYLQPTPYKKPQALELFNSVEWSPSMATPAGPTTGGSTNVLPQVGESPCDTTVNPKTPGTTATSTPKTPASLQRPTAAQVWSPSMAFSLGSPSEIDNASYMQSLQQQSQTLEDCHIEPSPMTEDVVHEATPPDSATNLSKEKPVGTNFDADRDRKESTLPKPSPTSRPVSTTSSKDVFRRVQADPSIGVLFSTASGKDCTPSPQQLAAARAKFFVPETPTGNPSETSSLMFTTASGRNVTPSAQRLASARAKLMKKSPLNSEGALVFSTASGKDVTPSAERLASAQAKLQEQSPMDVPETSFKFNTASGKDVTPTTPSIASAQARFDQEMSAGTPLMFCTAAGRNVTPTADRLAEAQAKLGNSMGSEGSALKFSTASGKDVTPNPARLQAARDLLNSKNVTPDLESSSIPTGSTAGFPHNIASGHQGSTLSSVEQKPRSRIMTAGGKRKAIDSGRREDFRAMFLGDTPDSSSKSRRISTAGGSHRALGSASREKALSMIIDGQLSPDSDSASPRPDTPSTFKPPLSSGSFKVPSVVQQSPLVSGTHAPPSSVC